MNVTTSYPEIFPIYSTIRLRLASIIFLLSVENLIFSLRIHHHLAPIYMQFLIFHFEGVGATVESIDARFDCAFFFSEKQPNGSFVISPIQMA